MRRTRPSPSAAAVQTYTTLKERIVQASMDRLMQRAYGNDKTGTTARTTSDMGLAQALLAEHTAACANLDHRLDNFSSATVPRSLFLNHRTSITISRQYLDHYSSTTALFPLSHPSTEKKHWIRGKALPFISSSIRKIQVNSKASEWD